MNSQRVIHRSLWVVLLALGVFLLAVNRCRREPVDEAPSARAELSAVNAELLDVNDAVQALKRATLTWEEEAKLRVLLRTKAALEAEKAEIKRRMEESRVQIQD